MEVLAGMLALAVAAGINLYATVLTIGLGIRYGLISGLPPGLEVLAHPAVLAAAGFLYVLEFVADKVPFVTPVWDAIHTFIRPLGAAALALGAAAQWSPPVYVLAALAAGSVAFLAHSAKMGGRLLAHAAPEPATHSAISLAEDIGAVSILVLAYEHPWIALPVLGAALAAFVALLVFLVRGARRAGSALWSQWMRPAGASADRRRISPR